MILDGNFAHALLQSGYEPDCCAPAPLLSQPGGHMASYGPLRRGLASLPPHAQLPPAGRSLRTPCRSCWAEPASCARRAACSRSCVVSAPSAKARADSVIGRNIANCVRTAFAVSLHWFRRFASGLEGRGTCDATLTQLFNGDRFDDTKTGAIIAAGALAIVSQLMVLHCAHEGDVRTPSECLRAFLGARRDLNDAVMWFEHCDAAQTSELLSETQLLCCSFYTSFARLQTRFLHPPACRPCGATVHDFTKTLVGRCNGPS